MSLLLTSYEITKNIFFRDWQRSHWVSQRLTILMFGVSFGGKVVSLQLNISIYCSLQI